MVGGRLGKAREVLSAWPFLLSLSLSLSLSLFLILLLSFRSYCDNHLHKESRNYGRQFPQTVQPDLTAGVEMG